MTVVVDLHPVMGMISSTLALLLTLGGFTALITRQCCKNEWKTARVLTLARIHKYFAYFLILWTQAAISTGLFIYHVRIRALPQGILLILINTGAFWIPLFLMECLYRRKLT
jgi:hypothetical protein